MEKMTAEEFNEKYPVGTEVLYWPGARTDQAGIPSVTRSPAWEVGDGTPVVSVAGKSGGIALSHIEPLNLADAASGMSPSTARARRERSIDPFDIINRLEELEDRQAQTDAVLCALRNRPVAASEGS